MKDFLLQYYMQRRFNRMPPEVRAQYDTYLAREDFRGNMKDWKSKLMHQNADGKWVENEIPDPETGDWALSDEEWKKLFNAFNDAFREMSAQRNEDFIKDNSKATEFLDEYFGDPATHIFFNAQANDAANDQIKNDLYKFLNKYRSGLEIQFKEWGITDDKVSYSDLLKGIGTEKYNSSAAFQKKIKTIAQYINAYALSDEFRHILRIPDGETIPDFSITQNGFDTSAIPPDNMDRFKDNLKLKYDSKSLLNTLETNGKVFDVFKQCDKGKISGPLEKAKSKVDYDNAESKDFVPPKPNDKLTPFQYIKQELSDTLEDYMDKYIKFRGDKLYMSPYAKFIVKAIDDAKIKATDGLEKVIDPAKISDIKKNLKFKSANAPDYFDWMVNTLNKVKQIMPKAFEGALKNGTQMRAVAAEMAMIAIGEIEKGDPSAEHKLKAAMEVMSVIKYGYTTSKIMDAFNSTDLTIFSDGNLSWNKSEAMKFMTNAMDKSIKFAFQAIGYSVTMVGNSIRLSGSKFNGKISPRMKDSHQKWVAQNEADRAAATLNRDTANAADEAARAGHEATLTTLAAAGIDDASIDTHRANLETEKSRTETARRRYDVAIQRYENAKYLLDADKEIIDARNQLRAEIRDAETKISDIDTKLADPATFAGMPAPTAAAMANDLMQQKHRLEDEIQQKKQQRDDLIQKRAQLNRTRIMDARANIGRYDTVMRNAETRYNAQQSRFNDLNDKINQYDVATNMVNELTKNIDKRKETVDKWDEKHRDLYREFMAYWDFLETGRDSHLGKLYSWRPGSLKKKQKKFDANSDAIFKAYLDKYQMTA